MTVYLISGKKGSGKDTAARIINKKLNIPNYSFASNLKKIVQYTLNLKDTSYFIEEGLKEEKLIHILKDPLSTSWDELTPRTLLINLGTFLRDNYSKNIWVDWIIKETREAGLRSFTVSDCRYLNEIARVTEAFYETPIHPEDKVKVVTIRIERPTELKPYASEIKDPSETELDSYDFDYVIQNTSSLENLENELQKIIDKEGK